MVRWWRMGCGACCIRPNEASTTCWQPQGPSLSLDMARNEPREVDQLMRGPFALNRGKHFQEFRTFLFGFIACTPLTIRTLIIDCVFMDDYLYEILMIGFPSEDLDTRISRAKGYSHSSPIESHCDYRRVPRYLVRLKHTSTTGKYDAVNARLFLGHFS